MKVSARSDYAVRAMLVLTSAAGHTAFSEASPIKADAIAREQSIPFKFLENILVDLRRAGLIRSQRGADGGYRLAMDPRTVSIADVIRAVDGPLAHVRGERPEEISSTGAADTLPEVWIALRASIRNVLEDVTIADVVSGQLPDHVRDLAAAPDARLPH